MRDYLQRAPAPSPIQPESSQAQSPIDPDRAEATYDTYDSEPTFVGYDSDLESDDESLMGAGEDLVDSPGPRASENEDEAPPAKRIRRQLEEPVLVTRLKLREKRANEHKQALCDIQKLLQSRKTTFQAGDKGLQSYRARTIESHLRMVVINGRGGVEASQIAAESHGFARDWGGRQVREWVRDWIKHRELPESNRGRHVKVFTLLSDPAVCAELRSYVRSNKWAMNPAKLAAFTQNELIPAEAEKYAHQIVDKEMPAGLKKYLEVELFPRIHLKVGKGICLSTARRWLHREGFRYMKYSKGLYYDGHDRPDVLDYRQKHFLPAMQQYRLRMVEYKIGEVETELIKQLQPGERRIVLVAHDEATMQANDGDKEGWVLDGEQPLKKKGAGRGLHQSDVICSTYGWLKGASVTMEYGKNYDGYWTGELFVKQVSELMLRTYYSPHKPLTASREDYSRI